MRVIIYSFSVISVMVLAYWANSESYKTKAVAAQQLQFKGYLVKNTLTKDVTILINESGIESAKTQAARERGVQIITNLKEIL